MRDSSGAKAYSRFLVESVVCGIVWHCTVHIIPCCIVLLCCGREIGRMDPRDAARDVSGARAYSQFLVESVVYGIVLRYIVLYYTYFAVAGRLGG